MEGVEWLFVQIAVGVYVPSVAPGSLVPLVPQPAPPVGLSIRVADATLDRDEDVPGVLVEGSELDVRLFLDPGGVVRVDQIRAESAALSIRARPLLGDGFDLALLGGRWNQTLYVAETPAATVELYVPTTVTLLGFSNTDFDTDSRLKHYFAVGAGPGAKVEAKVFGPVGFRASGEGMARTLNRHQAAARNQVRHEVSGRGEVGVGLFGLRTAAWLGAWGEITTQWETRDAGGKDGVDRQYLATGIELAIRLRNDEPREPVEPEPAGALEPAESDG